VRVWEADSGRLLGELRSRDELEVGEVVSTAAFLPGGEVLLNGTVADARTGRTTRHSPRWSGYAWSNRALEDYTTCPFVHCERGPGTPPWQWTGEKTPRWLDEWKLEYFQVRYARPWPVALVPEGTDRDRLPTLRADFTAVTVSGDGRLGAAAYPDGTVGL